MEIQDYLSEGISFFKDSVRLKKIADKIEKSSRYSSAEIGIVISKLRGIATIFQDLETAYKTSQTPEDKEKVKRDYEAARTKYSSFIKMINRETFLKALKGGIDLGIIGAAVLVGYKGLETYQKEPSYGVLSNTKSELKFLRIVNAALTGATAATALGFTMFFKKFFVNKGDELYNRTKEALSNLEKAERMDTVKKVEGNPDEQLQK